MPKILHTAKYTGKPLEILRSVCPKGFVVETLNEPTRESLMAQAFDADYFLVSGRLKIDAEILDHAPNLKMIQRTGVGTEMLDLEVIKQRNIPVCINKGINARSVAEHTLALILSALKKIPSLTNEVKSGIWKKQESGLQTHELYGKKVGLVGLGAIGQLVAKYLQVFGAEVLYTDVKRATEEIEKEHNLTFVPSFSKLLPKIDILSFHCPLNSENKGILNKETLSLMKEGAIVINTARGKLINEEDLYEAIKNQKIAAAALDVHYEEPIPEESKLKTLDNVIMTPHIGGLSYETFKEMLLKAMQNIKDFNN